MKLTLMDFAMDSRSDLQTVRLMRWDSGLGKLMEIRKVMHWVRPKQKDFDWVRRRETQRDSHLDLRWHLVIEKEKLMETQTGILMLKEID